MRATDIIRHPIKALQTLRRIPFERGYGGQGESALVQMLIDSGLAYQAERINYAAEIGDLANTQLMASAIRWVSKNLCDARLYAGTEDSDGKIKEVKDHPLPALLNEPNPYYGGPALWKGIISSRLTRATSYVRKERNSMGRVVRLWWEPGLNRWGQVCTRPRWPMDGTEEISYFEVMRDGIWYGVEPDDMIVFRDGYDPVTREGNNGVASLWSEFYTDKHASHYMANLMRHGLVPPVAIGIGNDKIPGPQGDEWERMKKEIDRQYREGAGTKPFKFNGPLSVHKLGFDYSSVGMRDVRRIPEERFCAVLGISPQSLRLGLGQENSTYNNVEGYTRLDYNDYIIPLQNDLAKELENQLLPEFGEGDNLKLAWDYSAVQFLQPDMAAEWKRLQEAYLAGGLKRSELREAMGYKFDAVDDDVYFMPRGGSLLRPDEVASAAPAVDVKAPPPENTPKPAPFGKSVKSVPPQSEIDDAVEWWQQTQDPAGASLIGAKAN